MPFSVHAASHGRRDENDPVASDEEHGDVPLGRPVHFLVGLLVYLNRSDGLLDVAQDHVEVLIVGLNERNACLKYTMYSVQEMVENFNKLRPLNILSS